MFDYFKKNQGSSTCKHCGRTLLSGEQCSCSMSVRERNGDTTCNHNGTYFHEQYSWKNDPVNKNSSSPKNYSTGSTGNTFKIGTPTTSSTQTTSKTTGNYTSSHTYDYAKNSSSANKTTYTSTQGTNRVSTPGIPTTKQVYNMGRSNVEAAKKTGCVIKAIICIVFFNIVISFIVFGLNFFGKFNAISGNEYYYDNDDDELYDKYTHESDYEYDLGSVSDDVYTNDWANISIPIPEGFSEIDEDEYEYYSYDNEDCAFMAEDESASYVALYTSNEDWLDSYSTAKLLETIADSYAESFDEMDIDYDQTTNYDAKIADANYLCTDFEFEDAGYFVIAVHRIETGYACLIVYDYAEVDCLTIIDSIKPAY